MARRRRHRLPTSPFSLLLALLFLLSGAAFGQPPPPQQQRRLSSRSDFAALLSLRASLGLRARDWPLKTDPCSTWSGVACSASGRVVGLTLAGLRRTRLGKLNPSFAVDGLRNLTLLQSFNASGFPLPGGFPGWFGTPGVPPQGLATLDLSGARVSGNIPPALGALRNLTVLRLPGNQLDGALPETIGDATGLTVLDLARNQLTGRIAASISSLTRLNDLDLSSNRLSGPLPPGLDALRALQRLSFAGNFLNDTVPPSLLALPALRLIDLSDNALTGELILNSTLPTDGLVLDLSQNILYGVLPPGAFIRVSKADISGNYFQGVRPRGNVSVGRNCFRGAPNQRTQEDCESFYANRGLVFEGFFTPSPAPEPMPAEPFRTKKKRNLRVVYIVVAAIGGAVLAILFLSLLVFCLKRRRNTRVAGAGTPAGAAQSGRRTRRRETPAKDSNAAGARVGGGRTVPAPAAPVDLAAVGDSYTYDQLLQATSGFAEANLIRRGHSGDLYHGTLETGTRVVVKRVDLSGGGEAAVRKEAAYQVELDFFRRASHERLVPLLGHCLAKDNDKLLVYKYMLNGDLASSLYRKAAAAADDDDSLKSLDWITRLKIAIGIAEALSYLHHDCTPPIVHRDIQASSVLLDDKFEVRLGSLSEVCAPEGDGTHNVITRMLRKSSEPSTSGSSPATCTYDVFCLGKVLLELVTGRLGISGSSDAVANEVLEDILPYISIHDKELLTKILDPSLILDEDFMEEVWAVAIVARSCLNPKPSKRPLVKYVHKALLNPSQVVREENISTGSARLRGGGTSSRSWSAAVFGSWRSTSDTIPSSGLPRDVAGLKRSETIDSRGSTGEHSFNHRKPPKEIFPEPAGGSHGNED